MKTTWKIDALALAMIAAMFVIAALSWASTPAQIPVHWNWSGQPDRLGGRFEGLLGLPLGALGVYLLLLALPRIDPRRANYQAFAAPYAAIRTVVIGVFFGLDAFVLLWFRGARGHLDGLLPAEAGIVLMVLGNYLPKVKSNWFVGVRTPWTLTSDASWRQTHRLAGWLFAVAGALTLASALVRPDLARFVLMGALVGAATTSVIYSYFAWKHDPAQHAETPVGG